MSDSQIQNLINSSIDSLNQNDDNIQSIETPSTQKDSNNINKDKDEENLQDYFQENSADDKELHLSTSQRLKLSKARAYIEELQLTKFKDIKVVTSTNLPPGIVNPGLVSGMDVRSLSLLSRIYVGSINFEITEEHIRKVFAEFGSVKHISMSSDPSTGKHKGFGFVEFDVPESANLALEAMNGTMLGGRQLKVGRPNNYAAALACITVEPPNERIFVSNVNDAVTEEDLKSIFSSFGPVSNCVLAPNMQTRKHKGYGFVEFESSEIAQISITAMNGFNLGNMILRVRKCVVGGPLGVGMAALDSLPVMVIPENLNKLVNNLEPTPNPSLQANQSNNQQQVNTPSTANTQSDQANEIPKEENNKLNGYEDISGEESFSSSYYKGGIVCLDNVCDVSDLDSELSRDIYEESVKFGQINQVLVSVVDPDRSSIQKSDTNSNGQVVKVFIEFSELEFANSAVLVFNNRWFGGRQLRAAIISRQNFLLESRNHVYRFTNS
ncbi:Poly(U)-binding-splicing factor PUF60-B [Smittium culicis]|uniref:Poly(U)-binding-splicing factor PUF60-B n=1 Tax=Smittium culicis TaxID=133412 RepID=A0A1R1YLJ7_9FUNG|nr:Poly(U)-binding-splicing factor PUF60-B [Smittium culicis]OMJ29232.1 Poly(U)-binding-splicing factor PUF60-B [Smittium culicis]